MNEIYTQDIIRSLKSEFVEIKGLYLLEKYNNKIYLNRIEFILNILSDLIEPVILSKFYIQNVVKEYNETLDYLLLEITNTLQVAAILNFIHNKLQTLIEFCIPNQYYDICANIKNFNLQL